MTRKTCVITVPDMKQDYTEGIKRMEALGVDAVWKKKCRGEFPG